MLRAEYEYETEFGKYRMVIPKIDLLFDDEYLPRIEEHIRNLSIGCSDCYVNILGSRKPVRPDKDGRTHYIETIEEYPKKMTLAEIEKKLGYKIELVSKKQFATFTGRVMKE